MMSDESLVEKMADKKFRYIGKAVASIAICGLGAFAMYLTNGATGIGWSVLALLFIWG